MNHVSCHCERHAHGGKSAAGDMENVGRDAIGKLVRA